MLELFKSGNDLFSCLLQDLEMLQDILLVFKNNFFRSPLVFLYAHVLHVDIDLHLIHRWGDVFLNS